MNFTTQDHQKINCLQWNIIFNYTEIHRFDIILEIIKFLLKAFLLCL